MASTWDVYIAHALPGHHLQAMSSLAKWHHRVYIDSNHHRQHRPCTDKAKSYSTDTSFSDEANYHLLRRRGKSKSHVRHRLGGHHQAGHRRGEGCPHFHHRTSTSRRVTAMHCRSGGHIASPFNFTTIYPKKTGLEDDDHCSSLIGGGLWA